MIADATELKTLISSPMILPKVREYLQSLAGAIDMESNHIGRIVQEVRKSKLQTVSGSSWNSKL